MVMGAAEEGKPGEVGVPILGVISELQSSCRLS